MKKLKVIIFLIYSLSLKSSFEIKNLEFDDKLKITQACQLFRQEKIYEGTACDDLDILYMIRENKRAILVAESLVDKKIIGILIASYVPNALKSWGKVVPWVNVSKHVVQKEDALYFDIVAVDQDFSHLGVATNLMEHATHKALDFQIPYIILSVFKDNHEAISCYKKNGFQYLREGSDAIALFKKTKEDSF